MVTLRLLSWRLPWRPGSLLAVYLGAICAVQLGASEGGLVRWSDYSVLAPLVAAALLPVRRTLLIGVSTLVASVGVYGFAIRGVSDGGRTVVIAAAALSAGLALVVCRTRLRLQRMACGNANGQVAEGRTARAVERVRQAERDTCDACDLPLSSAGGMPAGPLPQSPAADLAVCSSAAAGPQAHWLDAIPLPGARVALVAGSVVEDGVPAPGIAAELRAAVRTLADIDLQPDELLTHLGDVLLRLRPDCEAGEGAARVGASCLYAVYDAASGRCALACAGHPAPTVVGPDGTATAVPLHTGRALGQARPRIETAEVELPAGSVLLLHTHTPGAAAAGPGGTPARGMPTALARPGTSLDDICRSDLDALLSERGRVGAAVLAARTRTLDGHAVATWDLPAAPTAVSAARRYVTGKLETWGLRDAAPVAELIVSELVTNAIRHAQPPVRLRLIRRDSGLTCEVSDGSSTSPHLRRARTFDESGRGLFIVAQLTRRWGTRHHPEGKTIWAEQPHPCGE